MENFPSPDIQDNLSGAVRFWFAPVDDVASVGDAVAWLISSLTFGSGKDWYEGYSLPEALMPPSETREETESGKKYTNILKGSYPKDLPSIVSLFEEMEQYKFLVVYQDSNNQYKLIGSLDIPCRFRYSLNKSADLNQYDFEFYCDSSLPLYFIASDQVI